MSVKILYSEPSHGENGMILYAQVDAKTDVVGDGDMRACSPGSKAIASDDSFFGKKKNNGDWNWTDVV